MARRRILEPFGRRSYTQLQMRADVTFLGHSSVLIEMGSSRVLTDPVLLDHISILRRAASPLPAELYRNVDLVVISHLHLDHLDLPSLRMLGPDTPIVVPSGAAGYMRRMGFREVDELAIGKSTQVAGVTVRATPADHSGFRPPFGPTADAVGYVLERGSESVYFAGDTDIFDAMADLAGVDLALLPIWGWGPRLGPGHMDPVRAAEALRVIRPRAAVPIHWGTLWPLGMGRVMPHRLQKPPLEFAEAAERQAPEVTVLLTPPGETVPIPRDD
jgi:L-ascorbate metabolism protein UlaG (beta-lactamase superfamily)